MSELRVMDLHLALREGARFHPIVEAVDLTLEKGKTVALVGESGCGKTLTCLSILRLLDESSLQITQGEIRFSGLDLVTLSERELQRIRGNSIGMIFQDPLSSLNPVFSVGNQLVEALQNHRKMSFSEARDQSIAMLEWVKVADPVRRFREYPYQLSGGMRQRIMIAMALLGKPEFLLADEPTTALDVTIQAQILSLLLELQEKMGLGILLVTHDLGVVAEFADEVVVMYAGRVVEQASVQALFENPQHPYTKGLLASVPRLGSKKLSSIPGQVPHFRSFPTGCRFAPRCPHKMAICEREMPTLEGENGHKSACWLGRVPI